MDLIANTTQARRDLRANLDTFQELVDFLIGHLLAQLREDVSEFTGTNETVTLLVEYLETTDELLYASGARRVVFE